jgi:hypothetical protein
VRAGLSTLPGVERVDYDPGRDLFSLVYDAQRLSLSLIFSQIHQAGRQMGRDYVPEVVTEPASGSGG